MEDPIHSQQPPPLQHDTESTQQQQQQQTKPQAAEAEQQSEPFTEGMFSDEHPRHLGAGVRNGLLDACKGVLYGGVSLVAASVAGIHQSIVQRDPVPGVKGIAAGALGLVGFSIAGVYNGARQVAQGAMHTNEAIEATLNGNEYWDDRTNRWVTLNLDDEHNQIPTSDDDIFGEARMAFLKKENERRAERDDKKHHAPGDPSSSGSASSASDPLQYYAALGVHKDVTAANIKKTYTKKALESHPDKNPNDPNASARFQTINEAYRVLSNPVMRAQYDQTGTSPYRSNEPLDGTNQSKSTAMSTSYADSNPMEDAIAGGPVLRPWVGRLRYLLYFHPTLLFSSSLMRTYTQRKQLRAALYLRSLLEKDELQLEEYRTTTLADMVTVEHGAEVISLLASCFEKVAAQYESEHVLKREVVRLVDSLSSGARYAGLVAAEAFNSGSKAWRKTFLPTDLAQLIFTACMGDIETTAEQAATFVMIDASRGTHEERMQRVKKLQAVAAIMEKAASDAMEAKKRAAAPAIVPPPTPDSPAREEPAASS